MAFTKRIKDQLIRLLSGPQSVPRGLFEMGNYFRHNGPINFDFKESEGQLVAVSTNFRYGSIIAQGRSREELEKNIPDAILTSFEVPSSYAGEAGIRKVSELSKEYALA